jgi:hypothetical protein
MTWNRDEWIPAFAALVGGDAPTDIDASKMLDLATALSTATDPLSVALSFWIVGSCNVDLDVALQAAKLIAAWDDSEDQ